tara:strand:+ start:133 stop:288 length:156 start_codon:yes stop_codon:yes gene_type:complete
MRRNIIDKELEDFILKEKIKRVLKLIPFLPILVLSLVSINLILTILIFLKI